MKSMTGYYSLQEESGDRVCSVEIKAVNSRYYEPSVRLPHFAHFLEPVVRETAGRTILRGKVDINIEIRDTARQIRITVDERLAAEYAAACRKVAAAAGLGQDIPLGTLLQAEGVLQTEPLVDHSALEATVVRLVGKTLAGFEKLRMHDGRSVQADIRANLALMKQHMKKIMARTKNSVPDLRAQLQKKLEKIVGREVDRTMLITEAGILAAKTDINEELSRLESHIRLFETTMKLAEPVGRTLDFVSQEMNREVNTIGSKQADFAIAEHVVLLKSLLEKIREQIRNVE